MPIGKVSLAATAVVLLSAASGVWPQGPQGSAAQSSAAPGAAAKPFRFHLEEATIDDIHEAIRDGQISCRGLVQLYFNRAKAYNGVADELVTRDGAPIPPAAGVVRAGSPVKYPTTDRCHLHAASEFRSICGTAD